MKVQAITCPICGDVIYSRARHNMQGCFCRTVHIDGGLDYVKLSTNTALTKPLYKIGIPGTTTIDVDATEQELYQDWNTQTDKFGTIKGHRQVSWVLMQNVTTDHFNHTIPLAAVNKYKSAVELLQKALDNIKTCDAEQIEQVTHRRQADDFVSLSYKDGRKVSLSLQAVPRKVK